jgi:hypothetical protein
MRHFLLCKKQIYWRSVDINHALHNHVIFQLKVYRYSNLLLVNKTGKTKKTSPGFWKGAGILQTGILSKSNLGNKKI